MAGLDFVLQSVTGVPDATFYDADCKSDPENCGFDMGGFAAGETLQVVNTIRAGVRGPAGAAISLGAEYLYAEHLKEV